MRFREVVGAERSDVHPSDQDQGGAADDSGACGADMRKIETRARLNMQFQFRTD